MSIFFVNFYACIDSFPCFFSMLPFEVSLKIYYWMVSFSVHFFFLFVNCFAHMDNFPCFFFDVPFCSVFKDLLSDGQFFCPFYFLICQLLCSYGRFVLVVSMFSSGVFLKIYCRMASFCLLFIYLSIATLVLTVFLVFFSNVPFLMGY